MPKLWFTSDQHFGHANIIKYCNRPFGSVDEMNEELVRRHNVCVRDGDTVYHLGDFSLSKQNVPLYLPRLRGNHILIAGNHDAVHPLSHKGKVTKLLEYATLYKEAGFSEIKLSDRIQVGTYRVDLHHMPYHSDHTKDVRYVEWRPQDDGLILLHGHVHEHWKRRDRMINVGVDVWAYAPVSEEEIIEEIRLTLETTK